MSVERPRKGANERVFQHPAKKASRYKKKVRFI